MLGVSLLFFFLFLLPDLNPDPIYLPHLHPLPLFPPGPTAAAVALTVRVPPQAPLTGPHPAAAMALTVRASPLPGALVDGQGRAPILSVLQHL